MTKKEFEELLGQKFTESEYEVLEEVYVFHPVIKDVGGKEQIAALYKIGGMRIIWDMSLTAHTIRIRENEIDNLRIRIKCLEAKLEELKRRY